MSYKKQIGLLVLWVIAVIFIFKIISDKQMAALLAGIGFLLLPSLFLYFEFKNEKNKIHVAALLLFLFCSAIPIFLLRIFNWGVDFKSLNLLGIPAGALHLSSNFLYILVIISAIYHMRMRK